MAAAAARWWRSDAVMGRACGRAGSRLRTSWALGCRVGSAAHVPVAPGSACCWQCLLLAVRAALLLHSLPCLLSCPLTCALPALCHAGATRRPSACHAGASHSPARTSERVTEHACMQASALLHIRGSEHASGRCQRRAARASCRCCALERTCCAAGVLWPTRKHSTPIMCSGAATEVPRSAAPSAPGSPC